jgi:hypothetical protein
MSDAVAEIQAMLAPEPAAGWISSLWNTYNNQRSGKMADWNELKKYLFATDTSTTSNSSLPWKNSTTLPKLTQIRDNLHSNYLSSLFPNDKWLSWQAYTKDAAKKEKARNITAYMENKARESKLRTEVSKLIYDYIDYGNSFSTVIYEKRYFKNEAGDSTPQYIGPRLIRISPEDIVFNPLATTFKDSFKIIRSTTTLGELKKRALMNPDDMYLQKVLQHRADVRELVGGYKTDDFNKASQYGVDGFGSLYEYYMGEYVELLEFYGDYHNNDTGDLQTNRLITIADRAVELRNVEIPTYSGLANIYHVGWRFRPDNLWAMGPLDNLVGMQYRIDHLENLKADAMDLVVHPPLKIIGEVEEFIWGPGVPIHIDENGDVEELGTNLNSIIIADNQIADLEAKMELYAGAPREAMGIRSPGEKTAFEVQLLDNAAARIFQEKATNFEVELLEPSLNGMLEISRRNFDATETIRVLDTALGSQKFFEVTKEDITASGVLRPVGARHFAQQATELQNLIGLSSSPLWAQVAPHTSGKALTEFISDVTNLRSYNIFRPNVAITEQAETASLMDQAQEETEVQAQTPADPETMPVDLMEARQ